MSWFHVPAEVLNAQIAPANFLGLLALERVDLERDEPGLIQGIDDVGARRAVHPRLDGVADSLYAVLVPLMVFERGAGRFGFRLQVVEPSAASFVVYTS